MTLRIELLSPFHQKKEIVILNISPHTTKQIISVGNFFFFETRNRKSFYVEKSGEKNDHGGKVDFFFSKTAIEKFCTVHHRSAGFIFRHPHRVFK